MGEPRSDSRQRILLEAAALFVRHGYHGTSTRDIAAAVGMRQQSLFHHFPSKQHILAELLDIDLDAAITRIRAVRRSSARPSVQLYAHLLRDIEAIIDMPFDSLGVFRGAHQEGVLSEPGFEQQRRKFRRFSNELRGIVADGVESGDFRELQPAFVERAISALVIESTWLRGSMQRASVNRFAHEVAGFVLRALLPDPGQLDDVRAAAEELRTVLDGTQ
jgi:AcrR family transcriptional regulator